ncbi:hypothetical protein [Aeromonas simiae]|uniref:hypothetical protein n=1 Tax=Aeromonas simiae TaxID=218936 RepID=UPI00345E780B
MTMTPSSEIIPMRSSPPAGQPQSDRMTLFLANELFPLMAGLWPASASQLDVNAQGAAVAWGAMLRGLSVALVRDVVMTMAEDTDRQFAPRPAEVRASALGRQPAEVVTSAGPCVSIRACEMMAEARVFQRDRAVLADAVAAELALVLAEKARQGVTVTGKIV